MKPEELLSYAKEQLDKAGFGEDGKYFTVTGPTAYLRDGKVVIGDDQENSDPLSNQEEVDREISEWVDMYEGQGWR